MMSAMEDLASLPTPTIIAALDYETILATRKAEFSTLYTALRAGNPDLPAIETLDIESSPLAIVLQESAYKEMQIRALCNDVARQGYLYFAFGSGVDHLATFYDVARLPGESDERLKARTILAIQGRSTGGPEERYRFLALSASLRVADAKVYALGDDPTIRVALISTDNNGVADAGLIATVQAALQNQAVRLVNDTILVGAAVISVISVTAALTLHPDTSDSLLTSLAANLPLQWAAEGGIGRDLTIDWIKARLMVSGVRSVTVSAPASDAVMPPFQAVRIGTVTLTVAGRAY